MLKWIEVDLGNIAHNTRQLRKLFGKNPKLIAAVKADGYGHGAVEIARVVLKNGADMLAVANIDEAIELRKAKINAPILILNWTEYGRLREVIEYKLTQTIFDRNTAAELSKQAVKAGRTALVHIKVDTGMGRLGVPFKEAADFIKKLALLKNIRIEGVFSHFCVAESDRKYTDSQFKDFMAVLGQLENLKIKIPVRHIANSASAISYSRMRLNAVRCGISTYGVSPWGNKKILSFLKPAMSFRSKIVSVKVFEKGKSISYGRRFITKKKSLIADIPVGYADGYLRCLSNKAWVLVRGRKVPVVGTICMDQCLVDVTGIKGAKVGDEVVLFGCQGKNEIRVEEVAQWAGTIGYEILAQVGKLAKKIYKK